jgi:hypothetical protein
MDDKEFWEWCGFKEEKVWSDPTDIGGRHQFSRWRSPDGTFCTQHLSTYPTTLDNLFKYAVPQVIKLYQRAWSDGSPLRVSVETILGYSPTSPNKQAYWWCHFRRITYGTEVLHYTEAETPALALRSAIEKVIEDGFRKETP